MGPYQELGVTDRDVCWHCGIHNFPISRFPTLCVDKDPEGVEDQKEFAIRQFDGAQSVDRVERQETEDLIVKKIVILIFSTLQCGKCFNDRPDF